MTYLALAALFIVPALVVAIVASRLRGLGRTWWAATALTLAVMLVLTVVFDSLMIYVDLFRYDESQLAGVRLLLAPVEDLAWPLASVLLLPALWELVRRRPAVGGGSAGARQRPAAQPTRETTTAPDRRRERS